MKRRKFVSASVAGLIALGVAAVVLGGSGPSIVAGHGTAVRRCVHAGSREWGRRAVRRHGHVLERPADVSDRSLQPGLAARREGTGHAHRKPQAANRRRPSGHLDGSGPAAGTDDRLYGLLRLRLHRGSHQRDGRRSDDDQPGLDRRLCGHGRRRGLEDDQLLQQLDHVERLRPTDPLISTLAIDTLNIDPNDHNTVYAGTGDLNYGSFSMGSQGILKSTDAGATWTVLGEDVFGPAYTEPAGQFPQYDAVGKVRVDPNNSQKVVAGTKKGIFISYNGGDGLDGAVLDEQLPDPAPGHHRPRALEHGRRRHADHRRGRRPRLRHDRAVRPRQQRRQRALQRQHAVERLPELHVDRVERERLRLRHRSHRQPVHDRRGDERRQRHPVLEPDHRRPARSDRHRGRAEQPAGHLRAGAVDRSEHAATAAAAPGCQLGIWQTNNGGTSWTFMAGSQGPNARRLRLRLSAELVRPGTRGRPEQRRPALRRHL